MQITQLKNDIAASIFMKPCTEQELFQRDFCKNKWVGGLQRLIMALERDGAIYYKGDKMFVYKKYVRENLGEYELLL